MCNDNNDFSGKDSSPPHIDVIDLIKKEFIHSSSKVYGNPQCARHCSRCFKQNKVHTCMKRHSSGCQQTENNNAIHRIYEKRMCSMDENKAQEQKNKEGSRVQVWELASHSRQREQQVQRPWDGRVSGVYEEQQGDPSPPMPAVKCVRAMLGESVFCLHKTLWIFPLKKVTTPNKTCHLQ